MKKTINENDFIEAFAKMDRKEQFTPKALSVLFNWLEETEQETGIETELDVIAICCEFNEYASLKKFQNDYGTDYVCIEDIEYRTQVIIVEEYKNEEFEDDIHFIIQSF